MLKLLGFCVWGMSVVCSAGNVDNRYSPFEILSDDQLSETHATALYDYNMIVVSRLLQKISVNEANPIDPQKIKKNLWNDESTQQGLRSLQNTKVATFEVKILEKNIDYDRNNIHLKFDLIHVEQIDLSLNMEGIYQLGRVLNTPYSLISATH